jgi:hypothetical protein
MTAPDRAPLTTERLASALSYAISIIESYELDMQNTMLNGLPAPRSLAELGICQGVIYREAVPTIKALAGFTTPDPVAMVVDALRDSPEINAMTEGRIYRAAVGELPEEE